MLKDFLGCSQGGDLDRGIEDSRLEHLQTILLQPSVYAQGVYAQGVGVLAQHQESAHTRFHIFVNAWDTGVTGLSQYHNQVQGDSLGYMAWK